VTRVQACEARRSASHFLELDPKLKSIPKGKHGATAGHSGAAAAGYSLSMSTTSPIGPMNWEQHLGYLASVQHQYLNALPTCEGLLRT